MVMENISVDNLTKSFEKNTVIHNVSFEVSKGEFCILLGPSGCGKSTILRLIAGLEHQDEGRIIIYDREVSHLTPKERDIAMVFQSYALYPHMNVYENMAFPLRMQKKTKTEADKKVREAALLLGLEALLNRKPRELSGGQRQRVAIGRAIVRSPRLFLFDEPLSNLDAQLRATMRVELAKLHRALDATIIYVTHDQVEAMTLGQKIILLHEGAVQQIGTPREVYEEPSNIFVATFIGSPGINLLNGKILAQESTVLFHSNELSIDVGKREEIARLAGSDVTLGIRPEHLAPGDGPIHGILELIEHIGPEIILYLQAGKTRIIAKAPPDFSGKAGGSLSLSLDQEKMLFFHKDKLIQAER
jgi:ABC-type sugar transport system ATPase subunit